MNDLITLTTSRFKKLPVKNKNKMLLPRLKKKFKELILILA